MFELISSLLTGAAYDAAIDSVGLASCNGLYEMKMPEALNEIAK